MNDNIDAFIQEHTCASIACIDLNGHPYCFSCFYALDSKAGLLFFKSSLDTSHASFLSSNPIIAGTILPDKLNKLQIKGIQMEGIVLSQGDELSKNASLLYYKAHPMAMAMAGEIWTIKINRVKFTDNTLGFGKKIIWERPVI
jgi:uncharacterized protein YhbP (UPF0306 family)